MQSDLMTELAFRILSDQALSQQDMDRLNQILLNESLDSKLSHKDIKLLFKRFRQGITNFLLMVEKDLKTMEESAHNVLELCSKERERIKNLPQRADHLDPPELVEFIRKLDKPHYSFAAAEKLLGVARQTLRKYADNEQYGLKLHIKGRSAYLLTEDIINFHREKRYKYYSSY